MMKKIIPILLALLLMVGLMPISAFADEEEEILSETITLGSAKVAITSDQSFGLLVGSTSPSGGWYIGEFSILTISAANGTGYLLKGIEARISMAISGDTFGNIKVSSGEIREEGALERGSIIHVDNIDDPSYFSLSFSSGHHDFQIDEITIYYVCNCEHSWMNGRCTLCGKFCSHDSWDKGICSICGYLCKHKDLSYTGEICPICNYILGDNFVYADDTDSVDGRYFHLDAVATDAWVVNKYGDSITITAKNGNGLRIKRIEAKLVYESGSYDNFIISKGNKRETQVNNGDIIHIDDIHFTTFSMSVKDRGSFHFDEITVYYECDHGDWQNGRCGHCNAKCEHEWEKGKCTICGIECTHQFVDECCTICGLISDFETITFDRFHSTNKAKSENFTLKCDTLPDASGWVIGTDNYMEIAANSGSGKQIKSIHYSISSYAKNFSDTCASCGTIREIGSLSNGDIVHIDDVHRSKIKITKNSGTSYRVDGITIFYEPVSATASTISEGSIWIIVGVSVFVIGGLAALIIVNKKKKAVLAEGTGK